MSLSVRLGALTFKGKFDIPRRGFYVKSGGLEGWDDGADVRREQFDIPLGHGSFDTPGYRTALTPAISGYAYAASDQELEWMRSAFTGLLADGSAGRLVIENRGLTKWADVRLGGVPSFERVPGGVSMAEYTLQLWAPDPRRYGATNAFTGLSATIWHYGNFAAAPVLTVSGASAGGYTVTGPAGALYVVTADLVAGHPHVIDMATGLLSIDGVVQSGAVSTATTWTVPPGQQVTVSVSAGTLSVAVLDTYM